MPPIGLLVGKVNFTDLKWVIGPPAAPGKPPVTLNYGNFLQVTFDFLIVAAAVFLLVQAVNRLRRTDDKAPEIPPPAPEDVTLLREIRDLLKARSDAGRS